MAAESFSNGTANLPKQKLQGYLEKKGVGALGNRWKKRYFELDEDVIYYYVLDDNVKTFKGKIPVSEIRHIGPKEETQNTPIEPGWKFYLDTPTRRYDLRTTEAEHVMWYWIEGIRMALTRLSTRRLSEFREQRRLSKKKDEDSEFILQEMQLQLSKAKERFKLAETEWRSYANGIKRKLVDTKKQLKVKDQEINLWKAKYELLQQQMEAMKKQQLVSSDLSEPQISIDSPSLPKHSEDTAATEKSQDTSDVNHSSSTSTSTSGNSEVTAVASNEVTESEHAVVRAKPPMKPFPMFSQSLDSIDTSSIKHNQNQYEEELEELRTLLKESDEEISRLKSQIKEKDDELKRQIARNLSEKQQNELLMKDIRDLRQKLDDETNEKIRLLTGSSRLEKEVQLLSSQLQKRGEVAFTSTGNIISAGIWIPDDFVDYCKSCKKDFSLLRRKHHCRLCGNIFCYKCAGNLALIPCGQYGTARLRLCGSCFDTAQRERNKYLSSLLAEKPHNNPTS